MRILFDENIPQGLEGDIPNHECSHVIAAGWAGVKNGNLLNLAEQAGYQIFITFDKGITSQQRLAGRKISICVLKPEGQGVRAVQALLKEVLLEIEQIGEGEIRVFTNRKNG